MRAANIPRRFGKMRKESHNRRKEPGRDKDSLFQMTSGTDHTLSGMVRCRKGLSVSSPRGFAEAEAEAEFVKNLKKVLLFLYFYAIL